MTVSRVGTRASRVPASSTVVHVSSREWVMVAGLSRVTFAVVVAPAASVYLRVRSVFPKWRSHVVLAGSAVGVAALVRRVAGVSNVLKMSDG